ncbi:MAG: hypothetical protein ABEJ68_05520 [Halobacteriaceae archaeon]
MVEIDIYDSTGNEYTSGDTGSGIGREIEDYFFAQVRVAFRLRSRKPEIVLFFRAREHASGRAEQFYAVCRGSRRDDMFGDYLSALRRTVEDDLDMEFDTSGDDMRVFNELTGVPPLQMDSYERRALSKALSRGHNVEYGVGDERTALALLKDVIAEDSASVAISDKGRTDALDDYDVVAELGTYNGITPIGDTEAKLDRVKEDLEGELVDAKVEEIRDAVQDLSTNTSLSRTQIRNRLQRDISVLGDESARLGGDANSGGTSGFPGAGSSGGSFGDDSDRRKRLLIMVGVALFGLALLAALVYALTMLNVVSLGLPDFLSGSGGTVPANGTATSTGTTATNTTAAALVALLSSR